MTQPSNNMFESQALRFVETVENDEVAALNETNFADQAESDAYREVVHTWHATELLDDTEIDELMALDHIEPKKEVPSQNIETAKGIQRSTLNWVAAMSIILFVTGYLLVFSGQQRTYDIAIGKQSNILLSDGSELTAASNSQFVVSESWHQREVTLHNGSVFFDIAPNRFKPFTIETPNSQITVLGTAFSVYTHDDRDEIVVTHGKVKIESQHKTYELSKEQKLTVTQHQIVHEAKINTEHEISWLTGTLVFHEEPLEEVLEKINQYYQTPVKIGRNTINKDREAKIQRIKLSGTFSTEDLDGFLAALEVITDVKIEKTNSGTILLY
ncbi:MAG: FecR domain-containing protein [Pseudomonadales bacterium]|nr:FecR domain-containing protein [Pseudomonadales bacterium]